MEQTIRRITPEELPTYDRTVAVAFGGQISDAEVEQYRPLFEHDRSFAAFDGAQIAATIAGLSFDLTVPGLATLPVCGITSVAVLPTHRRRGLLRGLITRELDDTRERGQAIAVLTASESLIYGRFGFGAATFAASYEIDRRHADFVMPFTPAGRYTLLDYDRAAVVLPELYDRVRAAQPGSLSRSPARWRRSLDDFTQPRDGASAQMVIMYEGTPGQIDGAARYRIKERWDDGIPNNTVRLREILAATPDAATALWHYCFNIDLTVTVQAQMRPPDEPLYWQLADPRRLRLTRLTDDLWVRILDVPAALAARRYATTDRLVFAVADGFRPDVAGRYMLEGGPDGATCRRTDDDADLTLDIAMLGAAYLGGVRFSTLGRAGRVVEHTPGALMRADLLFASDPAPYCGTPF